MLNIYIGHDTRFPECFDVLADSIYRHTKHNTFINIIPLRLYEIKQKYGININYDPLASTEFTYTRFLIPWLNEYKGIAIFMDNDMLCLDNIMNLYDGCLKNLRECDLTEPETPALWVRKHKHTAHEGTKMYGCQQTQYPRKNWSSLMVMNCAKLRCWDWQTIEEADGPRLHRFEDVADHLVAEVPDGWNDLEDHFSSDTKLAHWTEGGPWYMAQSREDIWNKKWLDAYGKLTGIGHVATF